MALSRPCPRPEPEVVFVGPDPVEPNAELLAQITALQAQIEEQRALFDSLNDLSDVNRLAESLGAPELRNPLPDGRALRAAAEGDLSALGALADRADAIRRETRLYTPSGGELSEADAYYRDSLERAGAARPGTWRSARRSARPPIEGWMGWKRCVAPWTPPPTPAR